MSVGLWIGVGMAGGIGAVARALISEVVQRRVGERLDRARVGERFAFGTLAVNLSGAFALGLLAGAAPGDDASLLAGTALLGAYTTFSTWMLETWQLWHERHRLAAAVYVAASIALGLAAVALGRALS
ncbi:MAG: fluoride exporter [Solirubrobacteraceae bacterium]|nr:fluoride exporter [Solirubrobacteraceae bacterium]